LEAMVRSYGSEFAVAETAIVATAMAAVAAAVVVVVWRFRHGYGAILSTFYSHAGYKSVAVPMVLVMPLPYQ